jgi:hypothetical protein
MGLTVFLVTADGDSIDNPRHYLRAERALRRAQRRLARRTKGSRRRRTAVRLLARRHQQVKCKRRNFHHMTALTLLRRYDVVSLEDARVANMVRNLHLAKSISDVGWAAFRTLLEATAACAGRQVAAIPPAYTGQDGSGVLPDARLEPLSAAGSGSPQACRCARMSVRPMDWCWTATRTRRSAFCGPGRALTRSRGPLGRASPEQLPA